MILIECMITHLFTLTMINDNVGVVAQSDNETEDYEPFDYKEEKINKIRRLPERYVKYLKFE